MNTILEKIQKLFDSVYCMFDYKAIKQTEETQMHFIPISEHEKYYQKIRPLLQELSKGKLNTNQVILKLKQFQQFTLIHKEQIETDYKQLKHINEDIGPLFGKIAHFLLTQQQSFKKRKLNILLQATNDEVTFDKEQMLYLMSLMALNLVPRQQYNKINQNLKKNKKTRNFPFPYDFANVFSDQYFKTKTVIQYFKQHFANDYWKKHNQKFTIKRKYLAQKIEDIIMKHKNSPMKPYELRSDTESIQNFTGHVKVDFANKYIGGGALTAGCVQQEIMFANHPELFTSVIFCQVMNDNEALFFSGFKKYSKNKGYGWTTKYDGQQTITDNFYKNNEYIVAIDALHFPSDKDIKQVNKQMIDRQIKKAYVGFSDLPQQNIDVATGNWGCGAFNGDVRIKFMVQWLACSMTNKKMIYCPFGHRSKIVGNQQILKEFQKRNVGQIYQALIKGGQKMKKLEQNIFIKMKQSFLKSQDVWSIFMGKKVIHLD